MKKVLIVQPIAIEGVEALEKEGFELIHLTDSSPENIKKNIVHVDGLLVRSAIISREIMEKANMLKVISCHGAGVDHIDVKAATEMGIVVTNGPTANTSSTAELSIGLMLALARNILQASKTIREGGFRNRDSFLGIELNTRTLGIIGLGKIGRHVSQIAANGFRMKVLGYDPFVFQGEVSPTVELTRDWDRIFKESDFISLHLPLNKKTEGCIGMKEFKMMKKTAFLVNTARGAIIREEELVTAIQEGIIRGAGLDVFVHEPPSMDNPLFTLPNTILTPHIGSHSKDAFKRMAIHAAQGIIEVLNHRKPTWPVKIVHTGNSKHGF